MKHELWLTGDTSNDNSLRDDFSLLYSNLPTTLLEAFLVRGRIVQSLKDEYVSLTLHINQ